MNSPNHAPGCRRPQWRRARPAVILRSSMDERLAAKPRPTTHPGRSNDEWLRLVADSGPSGDAARAELRAFLVVGLVRVLRRRGVGGDLCEDLAQDALLRIRERLGRFRGESRFTTWALAVAVRVAFDELRHRRWKDVSLDVMADDGGMPVAFEAVSEASPERALARERVLAALSRVIDGELTPRQKGVLLAELEGVPHTVLAARLGMERNALYKLSHDARRRVRARLEAAGVAAGDVRWAFE